MKALTADEMREVDRLTIERHGMPGIQLMENAGRRVADFISEHTAQWDVHRACRVAILCGKGNNGGDGLVVARLLAADRERFEVRVYLFSASRELRGDAATNYQSWTQAGGKVIAIDSEKAWDDVAPEVLRADAIVDALFGTGLRGPVSGVSAKAIVALNEFSRNATSPTPALIVALDTPSGLPSDGDSAAGPVVRAHATVTFTAPKIGQLISNDSPCCGKLVVRQIGSPESLVEELGMSAIRWTGPEEFAKLPLVRAADSHKGTFGHALLLAGSAGKSGAATLAGYASLCAGAGLTTIACPDAVLPIIASAHAEYMTEPLQSTKSGALGLRSLVDGTFAEMEEGKAVLGIGPGLGTHKQTQEFIRTVVAQTTLPIVLDADGLNAFAGAGAALRKRKSKFLCVTPHPGEMARLLGVSTKNVQSDRLGAARSAAQKWNAYVVLKGFHTVLASPDGRVWVNTTGGPELAKGGSGDVLTGLLAALTAQFGTDDWLRVLALGVYLHGEASQCTEGWNDPSGELASSVAFSIPIARHKLLQEIRFRG